MKILVTGGAGFIGSNFLRWVLKNEPKTEITVIDALTYAGHLVTISDLIEKKSIRFVEGNICDKNMLQKSIPGYDIIFNFAAESHVDRSISSADAFVQTNVVGTQRILDILIQQKNKTRFVQVSTDEVYGSLGTTGKFTETSPLKPSSPYSATKTAADLLTHSYFVTHGLDAVITRSSNNFGAYQLPEKFLPVMLTKLFAKQKIPVYGDGKNVRDWLFVEDNCSGIWLAATRGKSGEVYNFGSSNEMSNLELVKSVLQILNLEMDCVEFVKDRPGHDFRYAIDSSKAQRELGWSTKKDFQENLRQTTEWYRGNLMWIKKVQERIKS